MRGPFGLASTGATTSGATVTIAGVFDARAGCFVREALALARFFFPSGVGDARLRITRRARRAVLLASGVRFFARALLLGFFLMGRFLVPVARRAGARLVCGFLRPFRPVWLPRTERLFCFCFARCTPQLPPRAPLPRASLLGDLWTKAEFDDYHRA
jgi:hypothetical protein